MDFTATLIGELPAIEAWLLKFHLNRILGLLGFGLSVKKKKEAGSVLEAPWGKGTQPPLSLTKGTEMNGQHFCLRDTLGEMKRIAIMHPVSLDVKYFPNNFGLNRIPVFGVEIWV
jgi:hypothetical protein